MSRNLYLRALLITLVILATASYGGSSLAGPTHKEPLRSWSTHVETICVESHVGAEWGVKRAVRQWNRVPGGPTFVIAASCSDHEDVVTVRYRGSGDRFTGWTEWFWDDSGHLVHADITVNPQRIRAFDRRDQSCMRKHTTSHELGHALGLRHYPRTHSGAVMSYLGWRERCGRLSAHDRSDFRELYPAGSSAAPSA
ncbi:matrixin family metalloprotease [Nocardioides sp.]|uniref:matrixin family metalloprotease n=1 Tax=Nocardioides sp. TaxID=35761 RepID=UPI001A337CCA|nr:matrixin family metalloprotease [Nocardioides sp.]MBJ7356153.1 matrixin family metalloprotease [Nocardioides sp.]